MKGIISYGAYVPFHRLQRKKIGEFFGSRAMGGEKAIAASDEDSVSMGVEAAVQCLKEVEVKKIDTVYFATVSAPYREKSSIPVIREALELNRRTKGLELSQSLRGATSALIAAREEETALVIAADCRIGAPDGYNEQVFGDGAAAFVIGSGDGVIARIIGEDSVQVEVVSQWKGGEDRFTQNWEEKFGSSVYLKQAQTLVSSFLEQAGKRAGDVAKVMISGPGARFHSQAAAALGFQAEQVQQPLTEVFGQTGNADAPLLLIAALEAAKPGDVLLVLSFAEGFDAVLFEVTEGINAYVPGRRKIGSYLDNKDAALSYSDYLKWRKLLSTESPRRPGMSRPSAPAIHRGTGQYLGLTGSRCTACGTVQFPKQRVCFKCKTKDAMEDYRFVGKPAKIAAFTLDYLAASVSPPNVFAVIDFEAGGRMLCELTDCKKEDAEIGMDVEMTFRRLYEAGGISNYFWKARPVRKEEGL